MAYLCDECSWKGEEPTRAEIYCISDPEGELTPEERDMFYDADGLPPRNCPDCGNLVEEI